MLIKSKGIKTDTFYIPPFDLNNGEIVIIYLFGGGHFHKTAMFLKDIFCNKVKNENVIMHKELTFVQHFIEPNLRRIFYPVTVGEYLKKNANLASPYATKIYEIDQINEKTKIKTLIGNRKKLLYLYATLSKTENIIFDLIGQGPIEAEEIYKIIKEIVKKGGSAILLDSFDDLKNDCTKYIELRWNQSG